MEEQNNTAFLLSQEGKTAGQRWPLDREEILIGRSTNCHIVLPERQISRQHARLTRHGNEYILEDLGSKNGTYLNGHPIHEPTILQDGDEIQLALCVRLLFVGADATLPLPIEETPPPSGLYLDPDARSVWVNGEEVTPPLSRSQYTLLALLYENADRVVSRQEIVQTVWPDADPEGVSEQAIDALVRRLRERLAEFDSAHNYILTVRGHGFRFKNR